jgi:hypothetical protein
VWFAVISEKYYRFYFIVVVVSGFVLVIHVKVCSVYSP